VVAFLGNWMFGVILFFLTLYLQNVLDLGPLTAGVVFLSFSVPLVVMSPIGGRLVARFGSQDLMAAGMALVGLGMFFFTLIDADSGIGLTLIGLVIAGFGQGFAYNISNTAGMESMPDEKAGIASGVPPDGATDGDRHRSRALGITLLEPREQRAAGAGARAGGESGGDERRPWPAVWVGSRRAACTQPDGRGTKRRRGAHRHRVHPRPRYVMLLGVLLCVLCIWPALWGRRERAPAGEHPKTAHPLWASLWRRHDRPVPAGSTPEA
jgi:Major Facilitator Superfamily